MEKTIFIEWKSIVQGNIQICNGVLFALNGKGILNQKGTFAFKPNTRCRLKVTIRNAQSSPGANSTRVTVVAPPHSFSFFLRDVDQDSPIYIPDCNVVITEKDSPGYDQVITDIQNRLRTGNFSASRLQTIQLEPEETFATAALATRRQPNCPTWLGLSRDMRSFLVNFHENGEVWDWIQPQNHSTPVSIPENDDKPVRFNWMIGRGIGAVQSITRRLEDGYLPILHAELRDGDILYQVMAFTWYQSPVLNPVLKGTHYLVADGFGFGNMLTESQNQERQKQLVVELARDDDPLLYCRVTAINTAAVPRYAWMKAPSPNAFQVATTILLKSIYDSTTGTGGYSSGRVYLSARLNGIPMPEEEMAILLKPGEEAHFEFLLPHRPLSAEGAAALTELNFETQHTACRAFWLDKLAKSAQIELPEQRINEMVKAGLCHLDLVTYGQEPAGTTAACIGVYCPIGSESAPIIQFFDSMGYHDLAQRSLMYFLDKQHDDGFIQNFGGYMLETGAALWSIGEHYRYCRDDAWVRQIEPKLLKACEFILDWSERNQREDLRGKGYGLLEGKVGDPEDPYHSFMLNGYAFIGLARTAEMLEEVDPSQSGRIADEADRLKRYILTAFKDAIERSPVVPLGDGTWCPSAPPWAEAIGPVSLFAEGGNWLTHGTFNGRDSLIGPLWLVVQEIVDSSDIYTKWMLESHAELMTERNTAFSQPYYSPHPFVHLKRGEVKPFLKAYYNTMAALADRDTYSFWEHFFLVSPHKTHEEAWFLMQTRWMLYMEDDDTLRLLPGIPRKWLEDGKSIEFSGMASYFGHISLSVHSSLAQNRIEACFSCQEVSDRSTRLEHVLLRLPHPEGRNIVSVTGGTICPDGESVQVELFSGEGKVVVSY